MLCRSTCFEKVALFKDNFILHPSKHINVETTLICQRSSTLFQCWCLVENESWTDVHLSTLFQRWQNNVDRIASIQRRWTKVVPSLKFGWKWKLSRRMFVDVVSALTKQRWNNVDRVTLTQCWWPNFVSTLALGWKEKWTQGMLIDVEKTTLKQLVNISRTEVY